MQSASTRSGRISFVAIACIFCIGLVVLMLFQTRQSAREAAAEFMTALANQDINKLTDLSYVNNKSKAQIHEEWVEAFKYAHNFLFIWTISADRQEGDTATVQLQFTQDPTSKMSYAEHKELQLVRVNGNWKVDVPEITRDLFPYLPQ